MLARSRIGECGVPSPASFPKEHVLIERPRWGKPNIKALRMMLLHDDHRRIMKLLERSAGDQEYFATLLFDEMVGIGPLAAEELKLAAENGLDISPAIPQLREALLGKYTKKEAATALAAHYLHSKDDIAFDRMLSSPDTDIAGAAREALREDAPGK